MQRLFSLETFCRYIFSLPLLWFFLPTWWGGYCYVKSFLLSTDSKWYNEPHKIILCVCLSYFAFMFACSLLKMFSAWGMKVQLFVVWANILFYFTFKHECSWHHRYTQSLSLMSQAILHHRVYELLENFQFHVPRP